MHAEPYIHALSQATGMDVELPPTGTLAFSLGGRGLLLQWNEAVQSFVAYVEIGPLQGCRDGDVCRQLLSANFLLLETRGTALSYNEINQMVALNYTIPIYGLTPTDFIRVLGNLVTLADEWKERLAIILAEAEAEALRSAAELAALQGDNDALPDASTMTLLRI